MANSQKGARAASIQVRAQALRQSKESASTDGLLGFAMMPDKADQASDQDAPRKGRWRQADVKRAVNAAEQAGLRHYRVEIAPDGTISIVVGAPSETPSGADPSAS